MCQSGKRSFSITRTPPLILNGEMSGEIQKRVPGVYESNATTTSETPKNLTSFGRVRAPPKRKRSGFGRKVRPLGGCERPRNASKAALAERSDLWAGASAPETQAKRLWAKGQTFTRASRGVTGVAPNVQRKVTNKNPPGLHPHWPCVKSSGPALAQCTRNTEHRRTQGAQPGPGAQAFSTPPESLAGEYCVSFRRHR